MLAFGSIGSEILAFPTLNDSESETDSLTSIQGAFEAMVADDTHSIFIGLVENCRILKLNFSDLNSQPEIIGETNGFNWINSMWIDENYLWFTHNR